MDRTAATRVKRYRSAQRGARNIARVEVQVPEGFRTEFKSIASGLRDRYAHLDCARRNLDFALQTINAPRPLHIDNETLLRCLLSRGCDEEWQSHIEAFFNELSEETIHDIVLTGVIDFEELYLAARAWRVADGRRVPWIKEMADFALAAPAQGYDSHH